MSAPIAAAKRYRLRCASAPTSRCTTPRPPWVRRCPTRASAAWKIDIASIDWNSVADAYLRIDYQGDVARLFTGSTMLDDHFYTGVPWQIGLKRFAAKASLRPLYDPTSARMKV